jgi:hypothetical protein
MITIRPFDGKTDYVAVKDWWEERKLKAMPLEMLPPTSFVAESKNGLVAGVWMLKTDCALAIMEWAVTNPQAPKEDRKLALELLIETVVNCSKSLGYKGLFTYASHEKWASQLESHGFIATDKMTGMVRVLGD